MFKRNKHIHDWKITQVTYYKATEGSWSLERKAAEEIAFGVTMVSRHCKTCGAMENQRILGNYLPDVKVPKSDQVIDGLTEEVNRRGALLHHAYDHRGAYNNCADALCVEHRRQEINLLKE